MTQVLQFRRPDRKAEVWLSQTDFLKEVSKHLGGHTPSDVWLRTRRKEGLPSGVFCNRLLIPLERGLEWLRKEKRIP